MNGAEILLKTAAQAGVDVCFTNPGTTELPIVAAFETAPAIRSVLGLFEGCCSGAADGYGRMTGSPAMTLFHLGPGLGNAVSNLHNARRAVGLQHALRYLGCKREDTAIIEDRMDTDIIAGINSDIDTVLVLSGVTSREDLQRFAYHPRYILERGNRYPGLTRRVPTSALEKVEELVSALKRTFADRAQI